MLMADVMHVCKIYAILCRKSLDGMKQTKGDMTTMD